jgi:hypothetical protein
MNIAKIQLDGKEIEFVGCRETTADGDAIVIEDVLVDDTALPFHFKAVIVQHMADNILGLFIEQYPEMTEGVNLLGIQPP